MRILFWIVLILILGNGTHLMGQHNKAYFKKLSKAEKAFSLDRFDEALELYTELYDEKPVRAEVAYAIGYMKLNSGLADNRMESLSYLKFAYEHINDTVPQIVAFHLGRAYQLNHEFAKAIEVYEQYRKDMPKGSQAYNDISYYIGNCQNGIAQAKNQKEVVIVPVIGDVNTKGAEFAPLINGEDNTLVYSALRPHNELFPQENGSTMQEWLFKTTRKEEGLPWESPKKLDVNLTGNLGASGLSADGRKLLLYVPNNNGDLYEAEIADYKVSGMKPLPGLVNGSQSTETSGSISEDGKTLYFSSVRRDRTSQGGSEIYMSKKQADGSWGAPVNLGPNINTPGNEMAPFIHPSGKYLYFHSNGPGTIGGDDIFRSDLKNGKWQPAENMGMPLNTAFNENYFVLSPDGKKGYFSSDRSGSLGETDLFFLGIPEEQNIVPLTLVKGQILESETGKPLEAEIIVVDKETGEKVRSAYNPDPKTGYYLMIFPPGKNYNMIIKAKGFTPYAVNINIPNQTYFYELYQLIEMKPVKHFDEVVGQEVSVKNAFYDTDSKTVRKISPRMMKEFQLVKDSLDMVELLDMIINSNDAEAYEYFLDLVFLEEPMKVVDFNEDERVEQGSSTYFIDERDNLQSLVLGGDTIFYAVGPTIEPGKAKTKEQTLPQNVEGRVVKVYYELGKSDYPKKYVRDLDDLYGFLRQYPAAGLEISGYADATGDEKINLKLSNERAGKILNYYLEQGVPRRRVVAKGFGQLKSEGFKSSGDPAKDRRVEIKIIEL